MTDVDAGVIRNLGHRCRRWDQECAIIGPESIEHVAKIGFARAGLGAESLEGQRAPHRPAFLVDLRQRSKSLLDHRLQPRQVREDFVRVLRQRTAHAADRLIMIKRETAARQERRIAVVGDLLNGAVFSADIVFVDGADHTCNNWS